MVKIILFSLSFAFISLHSFHAQRFIYQNVYGSHCGIMGKQTQKNAKMEFYIFNKDLLKINQWLFSFNKVNLAYGAEAIIKLENSGYTIKKWQYRRVSRIKKMPLKVKICRGCIYGKATLKNALSRHEFTK